MNNELAVGYSFLSVETKRQIRADYWGNILTYFGAVEIEKDVYRLGRYTYWANKASCKCDDEPSKTGIHWGLWRQGKFDLMPAGKCKTCWRKAYRKYCKLW